MISTFSIQWNRVNSDVIVALGNDLSIKIRDETLISSDIESNRPIAVDVEESLEGN